MAVKDDIAKLIVGRKPLNEEIAKGFITNKTQNLTWKGFVIHDTANDNSTIDGEVNYMVNNQDNAFVHWFIDDKRLVAVANEYQVAWGSGPQGNVIGGQLELVHVHSQEAFDNEIANLVVWVRKVMTEHNVPITAATVWSHREVSTQLGGSNHTDPDAYLAKWGLSWNDLQDLIVNPPKASATPAAPAKPASKAKFVPGDLVYIKKTATSWNGGAKMLEAGTLAVIDDVKAEKNDKSDWAYSFTFTDSYAPEQDLQRVVKVSNIRSGAFDITLG
jgi:N-acetylmuramoyl-L-alanine amidase CwlA